MLDSAFHSLQNATIFTKLDLRNAYNFVQIIEGEEWKTAFNTPLRHFEYLVMPAGLTNVQEMLNRFVFVYLDAIRSFSQDLQENQRHVKLVLWLLENRLFKAEKCEFHTKSITSLWFTIQEGQIC